MWIKKRETHILYGKTRVDLLCKEVLKGGTADSCSLEALTWIPVRVNTVDWSALCVKTNPTCLFVKHTQRKNQHLDMSGQMRIHPFATCIAGTKIIFHESFVCCVATNLYFFPCSMLALCFSCALVNSMIHFNTIWSPDVFHVFTGKYRIGCSKYILCMYFRGRSGSL